MKISINVQVREDDLNKYANKITDQKQVIYKYKQIRDKMCIQIRCKYFNKYANKRRWFY